ncbi:MAG: hypothetical protein JHC40_15150 [Burkholderiales bacterium]|nr:hypothetical protein [Burkholderiales bacterium]
MLRAPCFWRDVDWVFVAFFRKRENLGVLAFLRLHRLAEAQLLKLVEPFMPDPWSAGGQGLKARDMGFAHRQVGIAP